MTIAKLHNIQSPNNIKFIVISYLTLHFASNYFDLITYLNCNPSICS